MPTVNAKYISIFMTSSCDLECSYCYAQQGRADNVIDVDFAKKGIDDFFSTYPNRNIRFQGGGEPTLKIKEMDEILIYAREKWGDVYVELQTHGAFSDRVYKWILKNVDVLWISYDGLSDIQDIQRPDINGNRTSLLVEKNIKRFSKSNVILGIRACITSLNVKRQMEILYNLCSLGVKTIYADNVFSTDSNEHMNAEYSVPDINEYVTEFVKAKKLSKKLGIFYGSWLSVNFSDETIYNCSSCIPLPRLTTDGYVSSCDVTSMGKDGPDIFIYGKWDKDKKVIDYNISQEVILSSRYIDNLEICKHCSIAKFCAGSCVGKLYLITGSLFGINHDICKATKKLAYYLPLGLGREEYELEHP